MKSWAYMIASAAAAGIWLAVVLSGSVAQSNEPVANAGTLTCVASPGDKDTLGPERAVNCVFEPLKGTKANLSGTIRRLGVQAPADAKLVLVWSVLGPTVDTASKQLEGRYVGTVGEGRGANAAGLVGGGDGHIALKPLTLDLDTGENAAQAVLELQLSAMDA
ncbi:MAG: DUF992 domain-containing protein [Hyphomicrobiaceae bacterium]